MSPADYHRFHCPVDAKFYSRRHIAGYLESVNPGWLNYSKEVLKNNERVNLFGTWASGFFSLSFIGALNVGSISVHFDDTIKTNKSRTELPYFSDNYYKNKVRMSKGEEVGMFHMGSTVAVVFECPPEI